MTIGHPGHDGSMLIFMDKKPELTSWNILHLTGSFQIDSKYIETYHFYAYEASTLAFLSWQFHLHPGSVITTTSCVIPDSTSSRANFALVKGHKNYIRWPYSPPIYSSFIFSLEQCSSGENEQRQYTINEEDYYYVIFSITTGMPMIRLAMTINRTEFSASGGSPNCTVSNGDLSCSTRSDSLSRYALLQVGTPSLLTITAVDYVTLQWTCDPKVNAYLLIFFIPLTVLVTSLLICFGIYQLCKQHHRYKHRHSRQNNSDAYTNRGAAISDVPPPPYTTLPI